LWFGVNVACAKCHDHPLVVDWLQSHYFGMASFFQRTYATRRGQLGEKFDGRISYESIAGEKRQAEFMFLTGASVDEPALDLDRATLKEYNQAIKQAQRDDKADRPPRPKFRPREKLVRLALDDDQQHFFSRNIANRLWARFFGRGLVHPLDQMHSENPASHPDLLRILSQDLRRHDYDLKRLIHAITLTKTYARPLGDGVADGAETGFAEALPRPLSPYQLALSWKIASTHPQRWDETGGDWAAERERLEGWSDSIARKLDIPDDDFQVSVAEALWFSNNPQVQREFLSADERHLVGMLADIEDDQELIRTAVRCVLSRNPRDDEMRIMSEYLAAHSDRLDHAAAHLVWALMASPEFRFNH